MKEVSLYHLIVYTPLSHAEAVRKALAEAGAGNIGTYDSCSFSMRGTGRFRPLKGAKPFIGDIGSVEEVDEERVEVVISDEQDLSGILRRIREVHPYEEPAIHLLPMVDYKQWTIDN